MSRWKQNIIWPLCLYFQDFGGEGKVRFTLCINIFLPLQESAQSNDRINNVYWSPLSSVDQEEPFRGNDEMIQDSMATLDDVFVTKKKRSFLIESEDEDEEEGNEEIDDNMFDIGNPKSSQQLRQETPGKIIPINN